MGFQRGHKKFGGMKKGFRRGYSREEIDQAFDNAKVKHGGISLLEHLCELAYKDKQIAVAMIRKLVPDLKSMELQIDPEEKIDPFNDPHTDLETCRMMRATTGGWPAPMVMEASATLRRLMSEIKPGLVVDEEFANAVTEAIATANKDFDDALERSIALGETSAEKEQKEQEAQEQKVSTSIEEKELTGETIQTDESESD